MIDKIKSILLGLFIIGVFILFIIFNIKFYFTYISIIGFILFILNFYLIFKICTLLKPKLLIVFLLEIILYFCMFNYLPSKECGVSSMAGGGIDSCDCIGIITKTNNITTETQLVRCIGIITKCYTHNFSGNSSLLKITKNEVECK